MVVEEEEEDEEGRATDRALIARLRVPIGVGGSEAAAPPLAWCLCPGVSISKRSVIVVTRLPCRFLQLDCMAERMWSGSSESTERSS
jgi:hypothetical protein